MKRLLIFFAIANIAASLASCQKDIGTKADVQVANSKVKIYTEEVSSNLNGHIVSTFNL